MRESLLRSYKRMLVQDIVREMKESIEKPTHYVKDRKYEPLDVMSDWGLLENYYLASALKYIARYGRKDPDHAQLDLEKAIFYLKREIERVGES